MATGGGGGGVNQPLKLHQRCSLTTYGRGEILFVGQTSFSHGVWVGIALDEPVGKHDGVVQGKRYFTAHAGHGIFVRSSQVYLLTSDELAKEEEEEPRAVEGGGGGVEEHDLPASSSSSSLRIQRTPIASRASVSSSTATRTASPAKHVLTTGQRSAVKHQVGRTPAPAIASARSSRQQSSVKAAPPASVARVSIASRQSVAAQRAVVARPSTVSPVKVAATRTPAASLNRATPASIRSGAALTQQARSAVQAGRAPDPATARAGLRPIAKTRMSMAPPSAPTPRTAGVARTTMATPQAQVTSRRVVGAITPSVSSTGMRSTRNVLSSLSPSTPSSPPSTGRRLTTTTRQAEEEDLLELSMDGMTTDEPADQSHAAEEAEEEEEEAYADGTHSPSLRKTKHVDHMSLTRGPSTSSLSIGNRGAGTVAAAEMAVVQREADELRARLRIADKKRDEDRELIREAQRARQESEQFMAVKPKMIAKQQELQDEIKDLRKAEREWILQKEEYERQAAEYNDHVEILSLDKEVAEERAEIALEELQTLKDRFEELELDAEVLREENGRYETGPVDDTERTSVGYLQLEKQNERLREALIRLRDVTAEAEAGQRQRIVQLEKELRALDELQASYESVSGKLQQSEALLEDLKVQLDDALGAEEMLEQLTERNLVLTDKVDEMRVTIDDLEALKELNDELEETHVETEKQLQEELDLREIQVRELKLRNESLEANVVEYDSTFSQFRELVFNLQSEVETLRNDEKTRDANREITTADDQALLNLNLKLQSSSLKSQAKMIELENGKLEAKQAKQQLEVVSSYLPRRYFEQDKDAVESLLFFHRVAAKTEIVKQVIETKHDVTTNLVGVVDERLIAVCRMRHSLAHFAASARQIFALIQLASVPTFLKAGRMFKELAAMERRVDQFIDLTRREELKEDECAQEYRRFVKMLEEFEFALLEGSAESIESDLAAKEVGSATLFDLDLDTICAALGHAKQSVAALYNDYNRQQDGYASADSIVMDISGDLNIDSSLFTPLQEMINQLRSTKVPARKLLRRLTALYENGEAVKMEAIIKLPGLGRSSSQLVAFASTLATSFSKYVENVRLNKAEFNLKEVLLIVQDAAQGALRTVEQEEVDIVVSGGGEWHAGLSETAQLANTVNELLSAATDQENVQKVMGIHPWITRIEEIRQEQETNNESQRTIAKQTEDLRDLYRQIKVRDELIEENRIKIERLAKQLQRSKQDNETVTTLRDDLVETTKRMKAYEEGNSALQMELEQLQRQYDRVLSENDSRGGNKDATAESERQAAGTNRSGAEGLLAGSTVTTTMTSSSIVGGPNTVIMPSSNYEISYFVDQLEALRGVVRYLRTENGLLKGRDLMEQVDLLPVLPQLRREDSGVGLAEIEEPERGLPRSRKEAKPRRPGGPGNSGRDEARKTAGSKRLAQAWMQMASSPRLVVLPATNRPAWTPIARLPAMQLQEQKSERARIQAQIEALRVSTTTNATLRA